MDTAFISKLRPLLSAVAETMNVYVPRKVGEHFVCAPYDADGDVEPELNDVRMCTPLKEFLLPLRERAAAMPEPARPTPVQPFAVFGLKPCDLRSAEILDRVFLEEGYEDPFYAARRENLFTITADCSAPGETCFCHLLGGKPYAEEGFDLNVSRLADGYVLQSGSARGRAFLFSHAELFGDVPDPLLAERAERREEALRQAARAQEAIPVEMPLKELVERGQASDSFDQEARTCVECQGCTRICPTCHCFYLYDTKQQDYFAKMKMWDSCMRIGYAGVAGGVNPRKGLGDRLRHRFMHKFVWFPDRYGTEMCVGCGRCIDAETGDVDVRRILRRLNDEVLDSGRTTKAAK